MNIIEMKLQKPFWVKSSPTELSDKRCSKGRKDNSAILKGLYPKEVDSMDHLITMIGEEFAGRSLAIAGNLPGTVFVTI